jgi:hypothetical protein
VFSNDALLITGNPLFNGPVETAYPGCEPSASGVTPAPSACYRNGGSASPTFSKGISYSPQMVLPAVNTALQSQAVPATASGTAGCMFTGPTRIQFNSAGTMTVWSPYTTSVNPGCGTAAPSNETIPVPANNVIYVQNVPSSQSTPASASCAAGSIGGYPQSGDASITYGVYNCREGIAFVSGTLSGRVTVGADDNIIIVGNLTYAGGATGTDSLGLIAANDVEVYHPVSCSNWSNGVCTAATNMTLPGGGTFTNPTIDAAILSLNHSFLVQNYPLGASLGTLNVFGSIAQDYRGAVGTFSGSTAVTGYAKNYNYDTRLLYASPPFFLNPVSTSFTVLSVGELAPTR